MTDKELYKQASLRISQYLDGAITLHELINTLSTLELIAPKAARGEDE